MKKLLFVVGLAYGGWWLSDKAKKGKLAESLQEKADELKRVEALIPEVIRKVKEILDRNLIKANSINPSSKDGQKHVEVDVYDVESALKVVPANIAGIPIKLV